MRQFEKILEQSQFMHHFERRRMNGVTAKVAQKIFVLFKYDDVDSCARQQKSEHHARWAAAGNTTDRRYFGGCCIRNPQSGARFVKILSAQTRRLKKPPKNPTLRPTPNTTPTDCHG